MVEGDRTGTARSLSAMSAGCSGAWAFPSGGHRQSGTNSGEMSIAYCLTSTASLTSVTPTMSGNTTNEDFAWWELHCSSGTWHFDTAANQNNGNVASTGFAPGVSLSYTITGHPEAIFQYISAVGGVQGVTGYPWNYNAPSSFTGKFTDGSASYYDAAVLDINKLSTQATVPIWGYPGDASDDSISLAAAFACY
jgi:hypothetical protein